MNHKTKLISDQIREKTTLIDQINILKNAYSGEECFILTAGPSLGMIEIDKLREVTRGKLVIAVKQAYNIIPDLVDIHVINPYNYQLYKFINDPIKIFVDVKGSTLKSPGYNPDLRFEIDNKAAGIREKSLAFTREYERFEIDSSLLRPWGPGIMHELVIYLPTLFGCKSIKILGWDLGNKGNSIIPHYYETKNIFKISEIIIMKTLPIKYYNIYIRYTNYLRTALFKYNNKIRLNLPGATDNEANFIAASTEKLFKYYLSKNIKFEVISEISMLHDTIPRIRL